MKKRNRLILTLCCLLLLTSCQFITESNGNIVPEPHSPAKEEPVSEKPVEGEPEENQVEGEETLKIIFLGDSMMTSKVGAVIKQKGIDYPLSEFMSILNRADLVVANLETAIGTSGNLMEKAFPFQTEPHMLKVFEPIKEKLVFSLANNHGMDAPLYETMKHLNEAEYNYIGVGSNEEEAFTPYILKTNDVSIAVIAASRVIPVPEWRAGVNGPGMATAYSFEPLISYVKAYKAQVDHVIVFLHWGEELADMPNEDQLILEKKLKESGAKIIVGCHPHVIQELKWTGEKELTAFSLGNFLFTNSRRPQANDIMALELDLSPNAIEAVRVWPGKIDFGIVRHLDKGEEYHRVMGRIKTLSPTIDISEEGIVNPLWNK